MEWAPAFRPAPTRDPRKMQEPNNIKRLLAAAAQATSLGLAIMDSQTRFEAVNATLAREMRIDPYEHLGKTSCELVGGVALPMEQVLDRVLSLGKSESLLVAGRVRDTPEFGYWLNHCFPITANSERVQQLGLLVVNVTAESTSRDIFEALATDSKLLMADAGGLLKKFEEAIAHYHASLRESFEQLGCPFTAPPRKVERFSASIMRLDQEIGAMRELVYAVHAHFSIPEC